MIFFVDVSALIALSIKTDQHNPAAKVFLNTLTLHVRLITSNFILNEAVSHLNSRLGSDAAYHFAEGMLESSLYEIIDIDKPLFHDALRLLKKFHDKRLSFTDLTSFAIMRERKINKAFTFDHDFIKAGFEIVP